MDNKHRAKIKEAIIKSIQERVKDGFIRSQQVVPVVTGNLKRSGKEEDIENGSRLEYGMEYSCIYAPKYRKHYPFVIGSEGERKTLKNLKTGQYLSNGFGKYNDIIAINKNKIYMPKLYKITTESGKEAILTNNHILPTNNKGFITVEKLEIGDIVFTEEPIKQRVGWSKGLSSSDIRIKKMAIAVSNRWKDPAYRKNLSDKFKKNHWSKKRPHAFNYLGVTKILCEYCDTEFEVKVSNKRKFCSRECELEWRKKRYSGKGNPHFGKQYKIWSYGGGYRKDINHYVRSYWEANFARYLKFNGIRYVYEGIRFFDSNFSYCPDFWLLDLNKFIEIKGYLKDPINLKKIIASNPILKENLFVLDRDGYEKLENKYSKVIPNWELKK